jgi:UDP-glucose 4-epimerase
MGRDDQQDLGGVVKVLITGGAGYIGSTVASACLDAGITPVTLDSLVTGRREFARGPAFYQGDICDGALLDKMFAEHPDIAAVVHCAALVVVPESVCDPVAYYHANVVKTLDLVQHMIRNGCHRLLFSSTGCFYQPGPDGSVDEDSPIQAASPYGRTKAVCEGMLADIAAGTPLRVVSLRYFNPIGADPKLRSGLQARCASHALGKLIEAHASGQPFLVSGTDYPTRDGSGIRDYVHVWDLAAAHVSALKRFDQVLGAATSIAINLGTGTGTTVRELVTAFNSVVDQPVGTVDAPRRPGDVAGAFTRTERARRLLNWQPRYTVADAIADSLRWVAVRDEVLTGS